MTYLHSLIPLALTLAGVLILSTAIYFAVRFFAYKRSFPLPRRFDFLWIIATILLIFLSCSVQPPLEGSINAKFLTWIAFALFLLYSYLLIFVIDQFLVEYFLVSVLKIYVSPPLRKTIVLFVFLIAVLVAIQKIFNMNPWAVYAPTGILLPAIGFALKDAFQTFFAGVALSKIVHIGDWIRIGEKEGEVIDINWARTVLRGWEGSYFFVPNNELQKEIFSSFSYKEKRVLYRIQIGASYDIPPQKVKKVLGECAQNVDGVLTNPAPEVLLLNYADFAIQYGLNFWIKDYSRWREISSEVSTRIWYAFKRKNIEIPFPIRTVRITQKEQDLFSPSEPETVLSQIDLFNPLSSSEKQLIIERLKKQTYLKGEIVVKEGEHGTSFYIVLKGKLEVFRKTRDAKEILIGELTTGQFFGELSLLTGEPRAATIRTLVDSELLRLEKGDFQKILEQHPALAEGLAEMVTLRQSKLAEIKEERELESRVPQQKSAVSKKIREFFNLSA